MRAANKETCQPGDWGLCSLFVLVPVFVFLVLPILMQFWSFVGPFLLAVFLGVLLLPFIGPAGCPAASDSACDSAGCPACDVVGRLDESEFSDAQVRYTPVWQDWDAKMGCYRRGA